MIRSVFEKTMLVAVGREGNQLEAISVIQEGDGETLSRE